MTRISIRRFSTAFTPPSTHIDGIAEFHRSALGKRCMVVRNQQAGIRKGHNIPIYKYFLVSEGDHVRKGDQLTEGPVDPHDKLEILGPQEFQEWLVKKIIWRMQANAEGDLSERAKRRALELANEAVVGADGLVVDQRRRRP